MRIFRSILTLTLLATLAPPLVAQGNDAIAKLEAARARQPQNVVALRSLGLAYYRVKRFADARTALDQARRIAPRDGVAALYSGLSSEGLGDLTAAKASYNAYLVVGRTRKVKTEIRARLVSLAREESMQAAKTAVANESRISQTPGSPRTIAVPPMIFSGTDSSLRPLERGMADLIITDLSRSAQLTIVERDRMQALADEIRLSQSGAVDSTSAIRAGRLIQAGNLVNGSIVQQGAQLRLDARVVNVSSGMIGVPASVNNSIDALFAMEKQLVFQLFERLSVTLTPAERQLVERRATNNMDAFMAYSRGLLAMDDGRFEDAARYFENARALDPNFGAAAARAQSMQAAQGNADASATSIESSISGTTEARPTESAATSGVLRDAAPLTSTLDRVTTAVNPSSGSDAILTTSADRPTTLASPAPTPIPTRDAPTTTLPVDRPPASQGTVVVIIRRP